MKPLTTLSCNMRDCKIILHIYPGDVKPKLPWYCESHRNSCVGQDNALKPGEHPTTTLKCRYPGCDAAYTFDVADQIPAAWRCPKHRPQEPTLAQQPTISIPVKEVVTRETLQQKAFTDIAVMMAFNQFSEVGMKKILESLSSNSYFLGREDETDARTRT